MFGGRPFCVERSQANGSYYCDPFMKQFDRHSSDRSTVMNFLIMRSEHQFRIILRITIATECFVLCHLDDGYTTTALGQRKQEEGDEQAGWGTKPRLSYKPTSNNSIKFAGNIPSRRGGPSMRPVHLGIRTAHRVSDTAKQQANACRDVKKRRTSHLPCPTFS